MIEAILGRVVAGEDLSLEEMAVAMTLVIEGRCRPDEIALFLSALAHKGETAEEIAGAARTMRARMTRIHTYRRGIVDTCGTGGDGSRTFNISTAAALVAAAAGVSVAKHGNRRATSRSGSADVLAALGVNVEAAVPTVERCLDELGICFCFAPLLHASMKQVAEVRRKLEMPTIFNLLGPLTNPAGAPFQLLGVGIPGRRGQLAEALALLGTERALVVSGADGLDEVTLTGPTQVTEVGRGVPRDWLWEPRDFGLQPASLDAVLVEGPEESARLIRQVLAGEAGPARDVVVLNAAAALFTAGLAATPGECAERCAAAIDSGAAQELLARLVGLSNRA